jgi:hypothetical protein
MLKIVQIILGFRTFGKQFFGVGSKRFLARSLSGNMARKHLFRGSPIFKKHG